MSNLSDSTYFVLRCIDEQIDPLSDFLDAEVELRVNVDVTIGKPLVINLLKERSGFYIESIHYNNETNTSIGRIVYPNTDSYLVKFEWQQGYTHEHVEYEVKTIEFFQIVTPNVVIIPIELIKKLSNNFDLGKELRSLC